ncbi:hypothetical protein BH10PLA2_BH10PLA2_31060 [soil metagenome]
MNPLENILASPQAVELLLKKLHRQGQLAPLIREVHTDQLIRAQARQAGLEVTAQELQRAADSFRRRHGLHTAADTQMWLDKRNLSVDEFEAGLEQDLLASKVREHVTADALERHWQMNQTGYERLRLALATVDREDLAREVATQVRDEGRELLDILREHGVALHRSERFRKDLGSPLANAAASAKVGQLVGPVISGGAITLAVIEERRPAELDQSTRQQIQDELFEAWLAERLEHPVTLGAEHAC